MLDAGFIRENPDVVPRAMAARDATWDVDPFLSLDEERRGLILEVEALQAHRNEASQGDRRAHAGRPARGGRGAEGARSPASRTQLEALEARRDAVDTRCPGSAAYRA